MKARRSQGRDAARSRREPALAMAGVRERPTLRLPQFLDFERVGRWLGFGGPEAAGMRLKLAPGPDRLLCAMVLVLTAVGVVMVFSAGAALAARRYGDWTYFLKREVVYAAAGLAAFAFALRTDYSRYRRWAYPLLAVTIVLLAALLVVGTRVNGAIRWFRLGPLSFQPSEMAKFALSLYLALLLSRNTERLKAFSFGFLPPMLMTGVIVGLVIIQPDLGTAVILGVTALGLLFVSGTRTKYIVLAVLVTAPVIWKVLITGKSWRMLRLLAFLEPEKYCKTAGYQLCESLISIGSGGVLGQGLGQSRNKLFFLPEAHTDFILAIVGEELGLVGILTLMLVFAIFVWRGLLASLRARDTFGSFLAFAITCLFALQVLGNMGVVLGLLPTKGLALPFISYGGTSLVMSLFMAGVLANISARNPEPRASPLGRSWRRARLPAKNKRALRGPTIIVDPPAGKARSSPAPRQDLDEATTAPAQPDESTTDK
jgi:cell division protein FtsW